MALTSKVERRIQGIDGVTRVTTEMATHSLIGICHITSNADAILTLPLDTPLYLRHMARFLEGRAAYPGHLA